MSPSPRYRPALETSMSYQEDMTKVQRVDRVLRQLTDNIMSSRQSSREWSDVKQAYLRFLKLERIEAKLSGVPADDEVAR